jgi:hypothetical protein
MIYRCTIKNFVEKVRVRIRNEYLDTDPYKLNRFLFQPVTDPHHSNTVYSNVSVWLSMLYTSTKIYIRLFLSFSF